MQKTQTNENIDSPLTLQERLRYDLDPLAFCKEQCYFDLAKFPKQAEIIRSFFLQDDNGIDRYKYLILQCGMRSGKSTLTSLMALYHIYRFLVLDDINHWAATVLEKEIELARSGLYWIVSAKSEDQAMDTLFAKLDSIITSNVENGGFFSSYRPDIKKTGTISFADKGFHMICGPSHASGLVGRTAAFVAIDEFGHMKNSHSPPDGAHYLFNYLKGSTMTMNTFGKLSVLSSPVYVGDPITTKVEEAKSGVLKNALWYVEPTWNMNPFEKEENLRALACDEGTFLRDFAAIPGFVDYSGTREKLFPYDELPLAMDKTNILLDSEHSDTEVRYLGLDPAVKGDAFGIALSRHDPLTGKIIVDGVAALEPDSKQALDPLEINRYIIDELFTRYPNIAGCSADVYMYSELLQRLKNRLPYFYIKHVLRKEYEDFKSDLEFGKVDVVFHDKLYKELRDIEIVNDKRVDHTKTGSKDMADAVVQAYRLAKECQYTQRTVTVAKAYTIRR